MIVYHGSNHNFKTLKIAPRLCERESTKDNEGYGIYFSTNREVAESYGKYVYTLEINDDCFIDYRKRANCEQLINKIRARIKKETGLDIAYFVDLSGTVTRLRCGGLAVTRTGQEISCLLDSTEEWYFNTTQIQKQKVLRILKGFDKSHKAFTFTYHIANIGVIKDVSEDVVKIIKKEPVYLPDQEIQTQVFAR